MKKDSNSRNQAMLVSADPATLQKTLQLMSDLPAIIAASSTNCDYAIDESLARTGKLFSASRAYVMLDEKEGRYLRNTHEWVDDKFGPSMFSWPLYDYEYDLPSLRDMLAKEECVYGNAVDMPEDLRNVLGKQKVLSIMIVPLLRDGVRIGLVGLDFCAEECVFTENHLVVLRFLAAEVSFALERKQYQIMRSKLGSILHLLSDVEPILASLPAEEQSDSRPAKPVSLLDAERRIIIETLELYNGNKLKTAKHLGLTWPSLDRRCKKLGIEVKRK